MKVLEVIKCLRELNVDVEKFELYQFIEIWTAINEHIPSDKLKILANPEFDYEQMSEIREGFANGLSIKDVNRYADCNIDANKMYNIRMALEKTF